MKTLTHSFYIRSTAGIWFIIGFFILYKGLSLSVDISLLKEGPIFFQAQVFAWICVAFIVGFFKGRFVLKKTALKVQQHILAQPLPMSLSKIYNLRYLLLISSMMALAMCLKAFSIPVFYRGLIDIAVGFALINGSFCYSAKT